MTWEPLQGHFETLDISWTTVYFLYFPFPYLLQTSQELGQFALQINFEWILIT